MNKRHLWNVILKSAIHDKTDCPLEIVIFLYFQFSGLDFAVRDYVRCLSLEI